MDHHIYPVVYVGILSKCSIILWICLVGAALLICQNKEVINDHTAF